MSGKNEVTEESLAPAAPEGACNSGIRMPGYSASPAATVNVAVTFTRASLFDDEDLAKALGEKGVIFCKARETAMLNSYPYLADAAMSTMLQNSILLEWRMKVDSLKFLDLDADNAEVKKVFERLDGMMRTHALLNTRMGMSYTSKTPRKETLKKRKPLEAAP